MISIRETYFFVCMGSTKYTRCNKGGVLYENMLRILLHGWALIIQKIKRKRMCTNEINKQVKHISLPSLWSWTGWPPALCVPFSFCLHLTAKQKKTNISGLQKMCCTKLIYKIHREITSSIVSNQHSFHSNSQAENKLIISSSFI